MNKITIPILLYHKTSPKEACFSNSHLNVEPENFKQHLEWLSGWGFKSINMTEAILKAKNGEKGKWVVLSFDDGYKDNLNAYDIAKEKDFTITVFSTTNSIEKERTWGSGEKEPMLSIEDLRYLKSGGCEIGSHTINHSNLDGIPLEQVKEEIEDSKRVLEEILGDSVNTMAYPKGKYSPEVIELMEKSGYLGACTTIRGNSWGWDERFELPRVRISNDTSKLKLKYRLSGFYNRKR